MPTERPSSGTASLSKGFFWRAFVGCVLALIASATFAAAPTGSWWNTSFPYRYKITIPAGSSDLDAGYAVSITFNHAAAVTASTSLASGDDVRIVRWNNASSTWVELDRVANAPATWNTTSTRVWFKTAATINNGVSNDDYYLYYGNTTSPGTPPANGETVFTYLHDEFTGSSLDLARWTAGGSGTLTVSGGNLTLFPGRTLQSDNTFGLDTIWEARALTSDTLPGGGSKFFWLWLASNSSSYNSNHVGFYDDVGDYYTAGRNLAATANPYTPSTPTTFHLYSFTREYVTFIIAFPFSNFSIDGTLIDTISTSIFSYNLPTAALPVLLKNDANGSRTQVYDWMRVRPYRNPEPVPTRPATPETLSLGLDHFVVAHDGYGINCVQETITVSPRDSSNATLSTYNQAITLTTNTGKGTWTKLTGTGTFTDATANDGLATYQWVSGETSASFALYYPEGTQSFDVDVYQTSNTALRDDDTEGSLAFAPSGFTVTSTALVNGGGTITVPAFVSNRTAGTAFNVYIAAYGQTPTDSQCGIIEAYTGAKSLKFWTGYTNPATGTVRFTVDGTTSAATEGTSAAQSVTFTNGQATVSAKYKDVGSVALNVKDDTTGNPSLPTGIRGSGATIVKPSYFQLSQIRRQSDNFANPAAADASGLAFITAGSHFSATVTAYDAENTATPNYGKESPAESVALTRALVAPAGGNNPALGASPGFAAFNSGSANGTGFSWSEVGIITLTPHVADSDYLGVGDVTGISSTVGRFTPADFAVSANTPVLQTGCADGGFSYMGKTLDYATPAVLTVAARNTVGATTQNYAGSFNKLTAAAFTGRTSYTSSAGTLSPPSGTASDPAFLALSAGLTQLTYPTSLNVAFVRTTPVVPFTPQIALRLASFQDSDGIALSAAPYQLPSSGGLAFSGSGVQYYGRIAFRNVVGSELIDLNVPLRSEFYVSDPISGAQGFVTNTADRCASTITMGFGAYAGSLNNGETCVLDSGTPGTSGVGCSTTIVAKRFSHTPDNGTFTLYLRAPGAGNQGTVTLTPTVPTWLQYDWNPAAAGAENPSAIVTFGVYQGNARRLYTRERY